MSDPAPLPQPAPMSAAERELDAYKFMVRMCHKMCQEAGLPKPPGNEPGVPWLISYLLRERRTASASGDAAQVFAKSADWLARKLAENPEPDTGVTAGDPNASVPSGSCLICGHDRALAIWHNPSGAGVCELCRDAARASGDAARLRADAERYRWVRSLFGEEELDRIIDEHRAALLRPTPSASAQEGT